MTVDLWVELGIVIHFKMTVDLWVELGIVIHFKLSVDLECFPTRPEIETEAAQTCVEIVVLLCKHCQTMSTGLAVHDRRVLAFCLSAHIVHFQRENRQAIEEIPRCFRVQFCTSQTPGVVFVEKGEQPRIELLNLFMALLVEGVNSAFTLSNETLRGPRSAHSVFHVPQAKVA